MSTIFGNGELVMCLCTPGHRSDSTNIDFGLYHHMSMATHKWTGASMQPSLTPQVKKCRYKSWLRRTCTTVFSCMIA